MPLGWRRSFGRIVATAVGLASLSLGVALADPPKPATNAPAKKGAPAADAGDRYDPENVTAISQFMEMVVKGSEKYNAKDYTGAIDTFKKAVQLNPRNALGPYVLGEAYLATNNLSEA